MIMYRPNLRVDRLAVFGGGKVVFDERFHSGLNILRGENSSGKSTIMDFLFYGLGGDLFDWREITNKCDTLYIQVSINGAAGTLAREISSQQMRPMRIFMGGMDEALASAAAGWEVYPYSRGTRDSFSQVLFRLLGLPEVQTGESQTKITMNQILRLIYSDQLSPIDKIFRFQQFDDAVTRQTVGDLLCGAYSDRYYNAILDKNKTEKELSEVIVRIRSMITGYTRDGTQLNREWLDLERSKLDKELSEKNHEIENIEDKIFNAQFEDRLSLNDQSETLANLAGIQAEIAKIDENIQALQLEIADSDEFLKILDARLLQTTQSNVVVEEFGRLDFQFCPSCLEPIEDHGIEDACKLCRTPFDKSRLRSRSLKLINEFSRQIEQSTELQHEREKELEGLRTTRAGLLERWKQANEHYRVSVKTPTTEMRSKLRSLNREAGSLTKEIEGLAGKSEIIAQFEELINRREKLQKDLDTFASTISVEERRMKERIFTSRKAIENISIDFLKKDLSRQSTFSKAERVDFEFDGNRVAVNGDSFFSASSMVYLKNSFLASFMFAAANDPEFLHPRLLIMDTIEDKGMEPERSKNFQILLRDYSKSAKSEHQIIIATSMIAEELDIAEYTVGRYFTHEHRTLNADGQ